MSSVFDAVRTPFGRFGGALAGVRPDDLGAVVISALCDRGLGAGLVDEVVFGNANGVGEDNRNVGPHVSPAGGCPDERPGVVSQPFVRFES